MLWITGFVIMICLLLTAECCSVRAPFILIALSASFLYLFSRSFRIMITMSATFKMFLDHSLSSVTYVVAATISGPQKQKA